MYNVLKTLTLIAILLPRIYYSMGVGDVRFNVLNSYSYSSPKSITKDKFGFLWIGTDDGLLKYDGYTYTKYVNNQNDSSSISNSFIRSLLLDSKGRLWIATKSGLNLYDYKTDKFKVYNFGDNEQNYIYEVFESSDNSIWIGTGDGLKRLRGNDERFINYLTLKDSEGNVSNIGIVRTFYQDIDDNLWIGTFEKGILRYDFSQNQLLQLKTSFTPKTIVGISAFSHSNLLIGSYNSGLHIIDKRTGDDNTSDLLQVPLVKLRVKDLISDTSGAHWIGTRNNGLLILDNGKFENLKSDKIDTKSIPDNSIFDIYEDNESVIWISTADGIAVHNPSHKYIANYYESSIKKGLSDSDVFSISEDEGGNIYFGLKGSGIDVLDLKNSSIRNIQLVNENNIQLSPNANKIVFVDDTLWVATSDGLAFSNDFKNFQLLKISDKKKNSIISLKKIGNSFLFAGTMDGLYIFNLKTFESNELDAFSGKNIFAIVDSKDNHYWVAVRYHGFYKITSNGEVLDFININDIKEFSGAGVISVYSDSSKELWMGFEDTGLALYDLSKREVTKIINSSDGLPSNRIYTITKDGKGNLWVSTQRGIVQILKDSYRINILSNLSGLQSMEYNRGAFHKDKFGKFYYGGTTGVSAFYPQRQKTTNNNLNVLWTKSIRAELDENAKYAEKILFSDKHFGNVAIFNAGKLNLDYFDDIKIEFATTELLNSENIIYKSRMTGGSEKGEWLERRSGNREESFTRLPAGDYVFEVKASLNGIDWSEPLSLDITKESPPWLTWWAYILYILSFILFASLLMQKQLRKNIEKLKTQKLIADSEERLKLAVWGSRDELWDWNLVSGKIHRSNTWELINFPKRETDENGKNTIFRNVHPKDLPSVRAALEDHKNGYTSHYEATYRVKDIEGGWVWILDRGKVVEHDLEGKPLRMSGTIRNISDIKETQEQYDLIAKAFENTSDAVFILDSEFRYQAANRAYEKITGFKVEDKRDRLFAISSTNKLQNEILQQIRQSLILEGSWQGELDDTRSSGEEYTLELKLDSVKDRLDETTHYVGVFSDITFRKKAEEDLRKMANYDQLTGLPNRSLFQERLKHAISLCERLNKQLILLFIDLDNFKVVNDSLGHSVGDKLLSKVAERVSACVRGNDTVARLGGDEYTILLEQVESEMVGTVVADKILQALSRPFRIQGHELVIGCSIGIASYPDDGSNVEELLRNADTAMYSAKYKDKNNYQFFTESMNKKANIRLEMEHELRKAIRAKEISVLYQPKVSISTGEIIGCEALARWYHPEFGHVSPVDFIPLAEETGLIYGLGEQVLSIACHETRSWIKDFNFSGRTAVNLSTMQFRQSDLLNIVDNVLSKSGLNASSLELEITEGMLIKNPEQAIKIMADLRAKNIHLSIDDFGTGYASLAQLKKFPINTLKIDKAFIDDLTLSEQDANLVRAIISLSQNLGLDTVAEGVESFNQFEMLGEMGCDNIQGYIFSKPISANDFATLLSKKVTIEDIKNQDKNKILQFPA